MTKLRTFWLNLPRWTAPIFLVIALFILWDPQYWFTLFGPNPTTTRITVSGRFEPKYSDKGPYIFDGMGGNRLLLYCGEARKLNYCLDKSTIGNIKKVIYLEFPDSIFAVKGGSLLYVYTGNGDVLPIAEGERLLRPSGFSIVSFAANIVSKLAFLCFVLFPLLFIFYGVFVSITNTHAKRKELQDEQ